MLLLIFTGLLFALLLVNLSRVVQHKTNLSYLWSLAIVVGILAIALGMLTALFATRLASEATGLFETVQSKWQELSAQVQKYPWAPKLDGAPLSSLQNIKGDWISRIAGWFTSTFGMLSSLFSSSSLEFSRQQTPISIAKVRYAWFPSDGGRE